VLGLQARRRLGRSGMAVAAIGIAAAVIAFMAIWTVLSI
jgi:hypothetical protein